MGISAIKAEATCIDAQNSTWSQFGMFNEYTLCFPSLALIALCLYRLVHIIATTWVRRKSVSA